MQLNPIARVDQLDRKTFEKEFLTPHKPVIMRSFMEPWPARDKWTLNFFKEEYGDIQVPIATKDFDEAGKNYRKPAFHIPFREYLEKLEAGPTDYRIFLFNLLQKQPELNEDYSTPTITDGFMDKIPFLFFGGAGSRVPLHFDIDLSHVFLSQFHGRKKVLLFGPEQSKLLYHHPFTVSSPVDLTNPDYDRYPALKQAKGIEAILHPGDTLFMPSGWWHGIEYLDGGYSMALRARHSLARQAKSLIHFGEHLVIDRMVMNRLLGKQWGEQKERMAHQRAAQFLPEQVLHTA